MEYVCNWIRREFLYVKMSLVLTFPLHLKGECYVHKGKTNIDVQWALCSHIHSFKISEKWEKEWWQKYSQYNMIKLNYELYCLKAIVPGVFLLKEWGCGLLRMLATTTFGPMSQSVLTPEGLILANRWGMPASDVRLFGTWSWLSDLRY